MKLRIDIPVHHAHCVWQKKEHMSKVKVKVKVTENTKTTIWAITSEPEVVETSGWFQNVPCQNIYQKCRSPHDAWRSVFASHESILNEFTKISLRSMIKKVDCSWYFIKKCSRSNNNNNTNKILYFSLHYKWQNNNLFLFAYNTISRQNVVHCGIQRISSQNNILIHHCKVD